MNAIQSAGALALALLLAACGEEPNAKPDAANVAGGPASKAAAQVYSGTGTVQSVTGNKVKIAHGPIEGIGWPAMTMTFAAEPSQLSGLKEGSQVAFAFRQVGGRSVITSISGQ